MEKDFDPQHMYCMKSILPRTRTINFKPDDMKNYRTELEPVPEWITSYMQNCEGDSGSGQFISNNVNDYMHPSKDIGKLRYLLAGIGATAQRDFFIDNNGIKHTVPCGSLAYDQKTKKYLESLDVSISTTNQKILNWIKKKSNIGGKLDYLCLRST